MFCLLMFVCVRGKSEGWVCDGNIWCWYVDLLVNFNVVVVVMWKFKWNEDILCGWVGFLVFMVDSVGWKI